MKNIIEKIYYPYYYLFFRFYKFAQAYKGVKEPYPYIFQVVFVQLLNIYVLLDIFNFIFAYKLVSNYGTYVIVVVLIIFNLLVFMRKKKYKEIIEKFEKESEKDKRISSILSAIYFFGSIILSFITTFFLIR